MTTMTDTARPAGDTERPAGRRAPMPPAFRQLLLNTLGTGVTSSFVWFALTFWVFLETRSVVATGVIGGAFSISSAVLGPFFGTYVDRHRKHQALVLTSMISTACFAVATTVFVTIDAAEITSQRPSGPPSANRLSDPSAPASPTELRASAENSASIAVARSNTQTAPGGTGVSVRPITAGRSATA